MKVLVLGTGGREHALAWKIAQSAEVYLHPGNAGTRRAGIASLDEVALAPEPITAEAKRRGIELVVIGPETLLAQGFGDALRAKGLLVVGPDRNAARLESSKIFAKQFMQRADIPTAPFTVADSEEGVRASVGKSWPIVLKLDGLAAGKGVVVATEPGDVDDFVKRVWHDREFGAGPHRVVVEGYLQGREVSYLGFCDGKTFVPLASATDYKRVGDRNTGPNTGGMGSISPSPYMTAELEQRIQSRIVKPVLAQLERETLPYRGVLYIGLMVTPEGDPFVVEFNARFGDPETQAILLRLESDLVRILEATAKGQLERLPALQWKRETSVYVVGTAEGYPAKPALGDAITGLEQVSPSARIFFSGVAGGSEALVTAGGRVLGVGALGTDLHAARTLVYSELDKIRWRGRHCRTDIGI